MFAEQRNSGWISSLHNCEQKPQLFIKVFLLLHVEKQGLSSLESIEFNTA